MSLTRVKLHKIKSFEAIIGAIKRNWKNMDSIKIYQSPIMSDTLFVRPTSVLTVLADRVYNFKQNNTELLTSKLCKVRSKWIVWIPSTNFIWFQVTKTSKLLRWGLESGQLNQPWLKHICARNDLLFMCLYTKGS